MKKNFLRLGVLFLVPLSLSAKFFEPDNSQLNVGPLFNFARYKLGCLPKIEGYLAGVHADYIYGRPHCGPLTDLYASVRFDGGWNAGFICGHDDLKLQVKDYRTEFDAGYNFCFGRDSFYITPLVGIGFYSLSDALKPNVINYHYRNVYVPVGVNLLWRCNNDFQVELSAVYRINAHTRLRYKAACLEVCEKLELCKTRGLHVEVPFTWFHCARLNCMGLQTKIVPFFDWNHFGQAKGASNLGVCYQVSELNRWYLGLHVDFGVNF